MIMPLLPLAIGFVAGLRSMTAPAAVSWAACLGWIDLHASPLQWMGSRVAVAVFTLAAIAELVADKLPKTPRRTAAGPLVGRIVLGGLAGASLAVAAGDALIVGGLLGGLGAVIGAFAGYQVRRRLVIGLGARDPAVAIIEDLIAVGLAYSIVAAG
jgi:uncharacterized membrane protein